MLYIIGIGLAELFVYVVLIGFGGVFHLIYTHRDPTWVNWIAYEGFAILIWAGATFRHAKWFVLNTSLGLRFWTLHDGSPYTNLGHMVQIHVDSFQEGRARAVYHRIQLENALTTPGAHGVSTQIGYIWNRIILHITKAWFNDNRKVAKSFGFSVFEYEEYQKQFDAEAAKKLSEVKW